MQARHAIAALTLAFALVAPVHAAEGVTEPAQPAEKNMVYPTNGAGVSSYSAWRG